MKEIHLNSIYRDMRPPHRRWRVVKRDNDVVMLASVENPNRSRFHEIDKVLNPLLYKLVEEGEP